MVAREFPRNMAGAEDELRRSCGRLGMARKAFYTFEKGCHTITGPTVQLAREAMRCYGNFQAGMWELQRRPGWSEMMVFAWDLQTNSRFASTFRVNHILERKAEHGGPRMMEETEVRDIYELNTNMAARRLREQIKAALPVWFMEIAEDECRKTLTGGEPLPDSIAACVRAFDRELGVPERALVRKVGAPREVWAIHDLLTLRVLFEGLAAGELRRDAEFPDLAKPAGGSAAETLAAAAAKGDGEQESKDAARPDTSDAELANATARATAVPDDKPAAPPRRATKTALAKIVSRFNDWRVPDEARGRYVTAILDQSTPEILAGELTREQADEVIARLDAAWVESGRDVAATIAYLDALAAGAVGDDEPLPPPPPDENGEP
jgi:hypothetical protein